ncbi:4-hydroxyproline epimerase [Fodinicurvata fenggangensis]|uniref:4-hydroxyproline epimerase n=1 Tax=Fodinicurvata fenggangensis TaxID=1121830 RepID=UPI0004796D10
MEIKPNTFFCVDGHTCGNPVRLVAGGAPLLAGASMSARRQDFLKRYDWIRTALMFEPRGHDMMSGSILMPPTRDDCDIGILFIETSGCLPMCGHGTIGTVTFALERGLVQPSEPGLLKLDAPAGRVDAHYRQDSEGRIEAVRIRNVKSYLAVADQKVDCPELGPLKVDIAYGGNFYAIVEPQQNYPGLESFTPAQILKVSPLLRRTLNESVEVAHPEDPTIRGVSHILWTGKPRAEGAHARNAVFYGERAIDRSPCGTGTSARMAQLAARGVLKPGDEFVHESIIGSLFRGRVEEATEIAGTPAIVPSIEGWARMTGLNTIFVEERDPYAHGFQLT